jgi:hypothetical protein
MMNIFTCKNDIDEERKTPKCTTTTTTTATTTTKAIA